MHIGYGTKIMMDGVELKWHTPRVPMDVQLASHLYMWRADGVGVPFPVQIAHACRLWGQEAARKRQ